MVGDDGVGFGEVGEPDGGGFGFGAGGEFERFVGEGGFEKFDATSLGALGDDVEVGVGPGVFHVGGGELDPSGEDVGGVGFDGDGLLDFSLLC